MWWETEFSGCISKTILMCRNKPCANDKLVRNRWEQQRCCFVEELWEHHGRRKIVIWVSLNNLTHTDNRSFFRRRRNWNTSLKQLDGRAQGRPRSKMFDILASWHGGLFISEVIGSTPDRSKWAIRGRFCLSYSVLYFFNTYSIVPKYLISFIYPN